MSHLEISDHSLDGSIRVFVLRGQLDRTTAPSLARPLRSALSADSLGMIVDLTELTLLDVSGLALLRASQSRLGATRMALVSAPLRRSRLSQRGPGGLTVGVFNTRAEAMVAMRRNTSIVRPCAVRSLLDVPTC